MAYPSTQGDLQGIGCLRSSGVDPGLERDSERKSENAVSKNPKIL
jgi:hypothetical protein